LDEVEKHIKALRSASVAARKTAAIALGEIGDPRAVEPLTRALKDEHVRRSAKIALDKIQKK